MKRNLRQLVLRGMAHRSLVTLRPELLEDRLALAAVSIATPLIESPETEHSDAFLRTSVSGHLYYVDLPDSTRDGSAESAVGIFQDESEKLPLTAIPILHSNPDATAKFYLDFDGHIVDDSRWNDDNNGEPIHAAPYDLDGDLTTFNDEELDRINKIWKRVSEDFAPFEVDITTEFPGQEALDGDRQAIRALISTNVDDASMGGNGEPWFSAAGGVAFINSWRWKSDTPVWAFYNELNKTTEKAVAEALSHELGHAVGLSHDGVVGGTNYYRGHGTGVTGWAPIMGAGYDRPVTQWDKGDYAGSSNSHQNDITVITASANHIELRLDDHGNWEGDATPLERNGSELFGAGIITRRSDADAFSFAHDGGTVEFDVQPAEIGPNLDIIVELYNDQGLMEILEPLETLSVTFLRELPPSNYYLVIDGGGYSTEHEDGYSDYGSLGSFTILGILDGLKADAGGPYSIDEGESLRLDASKSRGDSGPLTFSWDINDDGDFDDVTGATPELTWEALGQLDPPIDDDGQYRVAVQVSDANGSYSFDETTLHVINRSPEVALSGPSSATTGEGVLFRVEASDVLRDPLTYVWDFGDGASVTGVDPEVHHVFTAPGTYQVSVTAEDDEGGENTSSLTVEVASDLPRIVSSSLSQGDVVYGLEQIQFEFSHDVSASLDTSDLELFNTTRGESVALDNASVTWIVDQRLAVWDLAEQQVPPGDYQVALLAADIQDDVGVPLDGNADGKSGGDFVRGVSVTLGGDVNLDFLVDFADFMVLSANFGQAGDASKGDTTGDGRVDFADFLILSENFGRPTNE